MRTLKIIFSDEDKENLRRDYKAGFSLRQCSRKYGVSVSTIRKLLGFACSKKESKEKVRQLKKRKNTELKEKIEATELKVYEEIFKDETIDIFEGIRQSVRDMLQLNEEQRKAISEMTENLKQLLVCYKEGTPDVEVNGTVSLFNQIKGTLEQIDNFYLRGKLRIDSRKELGNWFDRYKALELQQRYLNFYENVINAFFSGLNNIDDNKYNQIRETAIEYFPAVERYFLQNEEIPAEIINKNQ